MAHATYEILFLKHLLQEIYFCEVCLMELVSDNDLTFQLSSNRVFHDKTKHVEVECHFLRDKIFTGTIKTSFINLSNSSQSLFGHLILFTYVTRWMLMIYAPP